MKEKIRKFYYDDMGLLKAGPYFVSAFIAVLAISFIISLLD